MNARTFIGVVLIVLGAAGLIYGGITYTSKSDIVDLGVVKVQADEKKQIPIPPILGGVAMVAGVLVLLVKRNRTV